jgi:hypothetical protein
MPALAPENYLSSTELLHLRELESELSNLHSQRAPLAAKLGEKNYTQADFEAVRRLNMEIDKVEKETRGLLSKNPVLPENLPGFRG